MNKISGLQRTGMVAMIVASGYVGSASAAEVFREDFTGAVPLGSCQFGDDVAAGAYWNREVLDYPGISARAIGVVAGKLSISSNDPGGGGVIGKLDPALDFLTPGHKRKFIVKGISIGGRNDDITSKMFRFMVTSHQCSSDLFPGFQVSLYANGQFDIQIPYTASNGQIRYRFLIDANYELPRPADQVELTLDSTSYELAFVFNVADDAAKSRSKYQGAFTYRGEHGMTPEIWGFSQRRAAGDPYPAAIGFYAAAFTVGSPTTDVTVDSIIVTDEKP